ncbi:MAG: hypothetical protein HYU59_00015 [Magnetospirillum gryphiswaldense]|nr:hypothetical protein [Magnetospirillum gryphiswaldense]
MPPTLAEKAQKVKVGMGVADVNAIMGQPRTGYIVGSVETSSWVRGGGSGPVAETAFARFENGVLVQPLQVWPHSEEGKR